MHGPLLLLGHSGIECRVSRTASWVEATAVRSAAAAYGELAFLHRLSDLLLLPLLGAVASRVEGSHQEDGQDHHASLQDHERDFFVGKLAFEAVCQLGDTEAGTNQDEQESESEHY